MKCIAVIMTGVNSSHMKRISDGIRKCAREENANLVFFTCERQFIESNTHNIGEYKVFQMADFRKFDGVIIVNSTIYSSNALRNIYVRVREIGMPVVSVDNPHPDTINVIIDNQSAMYEITNHLIRQHDCKKLKIVTGPLNNIESRLRLAGFSEALKENGLTFHNSLIYEGNYLKASGENAVREFLAGPDGLPDAIVFSNDQMALGGLDELISRGIHVPEDVLVTGFDNDYETKYYIPGITSVSRFQEEEGYAACHAVLARQKDQNGSKILIETQPVFRQSCGCVINEKIDDNEFRRDHFRTIALNEMLVDITKNMSNELTTVDSFDQLRIAVSKSLRKIKCNEFYLMISEHSMKPSIHDESYDEITEETMYLDSVRYDDPYTMLVCYNQKGFSPISLVNSTDMMDSLQKRKDASEFFVAFPVHHAEHFFGYCIFGGSEFPFESAMVYSWVMNIGNAIENIRRKIIQQIIISRLNNLWGYDALTDLFNRAGFLKKAERIWKQYQLSGNLLLLFFADIDNLKSINDQLGHDEGDICITAFSAILKDHKKHGELIMRYGGDEFVIMSEKASDMYAWQYMTVIQSSIDAFNSRGESRFTLSASIGYCIVQPATAVSLQDAIDLADQRMYETKKARKSASKKLASG